MSEDYLAHVRSSAAREAAGMNVRFVQGDMREIPFRAEFDAVVNMFTAFGYFDSEADDQRVIDGAAAALKTGRQAAAGSPEVGTGLRRTT